MGEAEGGEFEFEGFSGGGGEREPPSFPHMSGAET